MRKKSPCCLGFQLSWAGTFRIEIFRFICSFLGKTIPEVIRMRYVPNASEDFLAELDRNEPARDRFYTLSEAEQQRIIVQARSVRDANEMRFLVNSIRA
jgi:hypothetical protein